MLTSEALVMFVQLRLNLSVIQVEYTLRCVDFGIIKRYGKIKMFVHGEIHAFSVMIICCI